MAADKSCLEARRSEVSAVRTSELRSRKLTSATNASWVGVGTPNSAPRREITPLSESISVRRPRAMSCSMEEVASPTVIAMPWAVSMTSSTSTSTPRCRATAAAS